MQSQRISDLVQGSPPYVGTSLLELSVDVGGGVYNSRKALLSDVVSTIAPIYLPLAGGTVTGLLHISTNAAPLPTPTFGTLLQIGAIDDTGARLHIDSYGTNPGALVLRRSRGTAAAPLALVANDQIGGVYAAGFDTAFTAFQSNLSFYASQAWTTTARGTYVTVSTTPSNTVTQMERFRIEHNGHIGVGTITPGLGVVFGKTALTIAGASSCGVLQLTTTEADATGITLGAYEWRDRNNTINVAASISAHLSGPSANNRGTFMTFITKQDAGPPFERMRIDNEGNVGVNTLSPLTKFHVIGATNDFVTTVQNSHAAMGDNGIKVSVGLTGNDPSSSLIFFTDATATTPLGNISRNGTASVVYGTTSDERLKSEITESERGLEVLMGLQVQEYRFDGEERSQHGLLAQDLVEVYPEAVHVGGEDVKTNPWMIDYGRLTPLLIKAVQDLSAKVVMLESKIAEWELTTGDK